MNFDDEIPELDRAGLREFGLTTGGLVIGLFGVGFPLLIRGWAAFSQYTTGQLTAWGIGLVVVVWSLAAPGSLRVPYRVWMRFAMIVGSVVSRIVLGIVFYAVVCPLGFVMRLTGKDPMKRSYEPQSDSYRVVRTKQSSPSDMERPF